MVGGHEIRETNMATAGVSYSGPNASKIRNKEETTLEGQSSEGLKLRFTTQVGERMKQMLISVMNTVRVGNMVVFGANRSAMRPLANAEKIEDHMIVDVETGRQSKIHEKNGAYVYPMTINRKKKKVDPNAMDVGFVNKIKYDAIKDEYEEHEEVECKTCETPWDS